MAPEFGDSKTCENLLKSEHSSIKLGKNTNDDLGRSPKLDIEC
jgi:hypothetical protein